MADASLLARKPDGIALVVGLNKVDRPLPAQAVERIKVRRGPRFWACDAIRDRHGKDRNTNLRLTHGMAYGLQ